MTLDRTRLAKVLGMLGSCSTGERDNAAFQANEIVRRSGMTWQDVLGKATNGTEKTYTKEDLTYAYQKGRKEGAEEEREAAATKIAAAVEASKSTFMSTSRAGQEWRDFARGALTHAGRLRPVEADVLNKFLNGGWAKPTPRQIATFFTSIANKLNLELPEE